MNTTTTPAQITLAQLERTSKNWDKRTKTILLFVSGSGNMFGGGGKGYCLTLHGENSIHPTGQIDINGIFERSYNISRGANGDNCGHVSYYKGVDSLDLAEVFGKPPTFRIDVTGSCDTGMDTLCAILQAEKDWIIN